MIRTQWIRADWQCSNYGNANVRDVCQGLFSFCLWHCSRFIWYVQYPTIIIWYVQYPTIIINLKLPTPQFEHCTLSSISCQKEGLDFVQIQKCTIHSVKLHSAGSHIRWSNGKWFSVFRTVSVLLWGMVLEIDIGLDIGRSVYHFLQYIYIQTRYTM